MDLVCPHCGKLLPSSDSQLGRTVTCPGCNRSFTASWAQVARASGSLTSLRPARPVRRRRLRVDLRVSTLAGLVAGLLLSGFYCAWSNPVLIAVGLVLGVGGGFLGGVRINADLSRVRFERRRTAAMAKVARDCNLAFTEEISNEEMVQFGLDELFDEGYSHRVRNLMQERRPSAELVILDCLYGVYDGEYSHTFRVSVAVFPRGGQTMPEFRLDRQGFLNRPISERVARLQGACPIVLEGTATRDAFHRRYYLQGEDTAALRLLLSDAVLEYLLSSKWWVLSRKGRLIFHKGKAYAARSLPEFMSEAKQLQELLAREARNSEKVLMTVEELGRDTPRALSSVSRFENARLGCGTIGAIAGFIGTWALGRAVGIALAPWWWLSAGLVMGAFAGFAVATAIARR